MLLQSGAVVLQILATSSGLPAPRSQLDAWVNTYDLRISMVIDPPGVGTRTLSTYGVRESVFIVDLRTMVIVEKYNGSVAGIGPSGVAQAIPRLVELLREP